MDMALAIHRINPAAAYRLNATHDAIVEWRGPGTQPTAQQITDAWNAIEAERTAREQEAAAIAVLRQALGQELSRRLTTAPGKPYENTETCWDTLGVASKAARYLGLVDPGAFVDRRNPEPLLNVAADPGAPQLSITDELWYDHAELPDFPEPPDYSLDNYQGQQPYHLEIWCEKSTMNDVLEPLCRSYGANLQVGVGELSITATLAMVRRLKVSGKPARIFYVSDFDPAGLSMPVAVSRKLEFFVRALPGVDVRLFPVVLTAEQVRTYHLPRTPIKDTERRRDSFELRHGSGAVELDALEALHPGVLRQVLRGYIERYFDTDLDLRVLDAQTKLYADLRAKRQAIIERHQLEIDALQEEYNQIRREFSARMQGYSRRLSAEWLAIRQKNRWVLANDLVVDAP